MQNNVARAVRRLRRVGARLLHGAAPGAVPQQLGLDAIAGLDCGELENLSRELASPMYLGDHVGLCRILGRYKLYLDTRDIALAAHVLLDGYWESWITQFVARRVQRGWTAIDVGANVGYYSLLLADLVGPEGHVFAVEPNPALTPLLRRSVALNGFAQRTTVCEVAAGSPDDRFTRLMIPDRSPGQSALVADPDLAMPDCINLEVPIATLDSLVGPGRRVDFIKLDAEGSEQRIVAGMAGILETHRPEMLLEFNPGRYDQPAAFLAYLADLYGSLRQIDIAGKAVPIAAEQVLATETEWMLFLGPR